MSKRFFFLGFLAILLLVPRPSNAGLYDPKLHWKTVDTPNFSFHYYDGEEEVVRRLVSLSESVYKNLSTKFNAHPWGRTEVVVVDNNDDSNGFTTVIPYNWITLRIVAPVPDSSLADYDDWLRELFAHEYTHVLHLSDTGYPAKALKFFLGKLVAPNGLTPGWVTEGLAVYFETDQTGRGRGRSSFTDMLLRTDILQDRFLHLDQMAGTQYEWPSWMAQYLYGVGFWEYLSEKYGEEKLIAFSHEYGSTLWFFSLNNKAKKVFGKSFYKLWDDWREELTERYATVKVEREATGLREGEAWRAVKRGESQVQPLFEGNSFVYLDSSIDHPTELRLKDRVLLKKRDLSQFTIDSEAERLVFSNIRPARGFYRYSDLEEITLKTGKVRRLTKGERLRDPDFSPDGKSVVVVRQKTGASELGLFDLKEKKFTAFPFKGPAEFNHPRWSPNGKLIVVSVHFKGQRDLWLVDPKGKHWKRLTNNVAIEDRPAWDSAGRTLYYSSDRDGISNIYRYDLGRGTTERVTNVLTGAFAPTVSPAGELWFQYYNGRGFEIRRMKLGGLAVPIPLRESAASGRTLTPLAGGKPSAAGRPQSGPPSAAFLARSRRWVPLPPGKDSLNGLGTDSPHEYHPFGKLLVPRYLLPNAILLDNAVFLSLATGNTDPLIRHQWSADVNFRTDDNFLGYGFGYSYNRFRIAPYASFADFVVNYGDLFSFGQNYFEERKRGSGGLSFASGRGNFSLGYFFENRGIESGIPAGFTLTTLGHYAGIAAGYRYGYKTATAAAISPESGGTFAANAEVTHEKLGSSSNLEQQVFWGDGRLYLPVPFGPHHVLALRGAGGVAFGDQLLQGNFVLGGGVGESPFTATSTRLFTLRGLPFATFARNRVWVTSAEYRLPFFRVQRGIGTLPFAVNSAHLAFFADMGDTFNEGTLQFKPLLGLGGELRGDFIVGYHIPVMGRVGYGIIVTNRNRITGAKDALTGSDARNGVLILEVGTSF